MIFRMKKLVRILLDWLFFNALIKGVAAGVEHRRLLLALGDEMRHVIDIGANRGQFALVARKCFPFAKIDSFEPLVEPAEIFERVFDGDVNTKLHRFAIGPEKSISIMHVSNRDDSSSLLPISGLQTALFPNTKERGTREVYVAPLAEILTGAILEPALLKIDVQGYELLVLQGCLSLLANFKHIYVECSFIELYVGQSLASEVIDFLAKQNFRLVGVYNLYYGPDGRSIQADFLFQRA